MKNTQIIRFLTGLSFLIFFCPFFQMCSDESIMKVTLKKELAVPIDTSLEERERLYTEERLRLKTERKKTVEDNRERYTLNAYELAVFPFINPEELTLNDIFDVNLYAFLCYTSMIILSVLFFINSILKRYKRVLHQSIIILFLMVISLIIFYMREDLEDINQIKWGYYLFSTNILAIIYLARKTQLNGTTHAI